MNVGIDALRGMLHCSDWDDLVAEDYSDYNDGSSSEFENEAMYRNFREQLFKEAALLHVHLTPGLYENVHFGRFCREKAEMVRHILKAAILHEDPPHVIAEWQSHRPIRVRVGNFGPESRFLYYYVDGKPYLGEIKLDRTRTRSEHDAFNEEWPEIKVPMRRINQDGAWFKIFRGKVTWEPPRGAPTR